jgi:beta-glucosidase
MRNLYLLPSSPIAALKKLLPKAQIEYDPGKAGRVGPVGAAFGCRHRFLGFASRVRASIFPI